MTSATNVKTNTSIMMKVKKLRNVRTTRNVIKTEKIRKNTEVEKETVMTTRNIRGGTLKVIRDSRDRNRRKYSRSRSSDRRE